MIPYQLKSFMENTLSATERGQLQWFDSGNHSFFCNHKNATLHISTYYDVDKDESYYTFAIQADGKYTPFTVYDFERQEYFFMGSLWDAIVVSANDPLANLSDFF